MLRMTPNTSMTRVISSARPRKVRTLRRLSPSVSPIRNFSESPSLTPNSVKTAVMTVTNPNPPIWMSSITTICPNSVKVSMTTTEESPVMHTALVETNSASMKAMP